MNSSVWLERKFLWEKTSINLSGLKQIQRMLVEFDIGSKIGSGYGSRRNVYALIIIDLKRFHDKIGFNLNRKQERLAQR